MIVFLSESSPDCGIFNQEATQKYRAGHAEYKIPNTFLQILNSYYKKNLLHTRFSYSNDTFSLPSDQKCNN